MLNEKNRFYGTTKLISLDELKSIFDSEIFKYLKVVLLFGSRASGEFHPRSDYDFAVVFDEDDSEVWGVLSKVWVDVGRELKLKEIDYDIIDITTASPEMLQSINKEYIILKGDKDDISRLLR